MKYCVSYSANVPDEQVDGADHRAVLRTIDARFPRGSIVGICGARGGNPRFYMKREDGDTAWPISAVTAATFSPVMVGVKR